MFKLLNIFNSKISYYKILFQKFNKGIINYKNLMHSKSILLTKALLKSLKSINKLQSSSLKSKDSNKIYSILMKLLTLILLIKNMMIVKISSSMHKWYGQSMSMIKTKCSSESLLTANLGKVWEMCWGKIMISTIKEFLILPVKITAKKEVSHVALLTQECPFKIVKNLSEKRTHLTTKYTCKISKILNQVHLMNKITFKAKRKTTHWNNHKNY